jgi:superfamily II DNA/RNA helicase
VVNVESTQFNEKIKSKRVSPFIKPDKSWEDEEFGIPNEIIRGIVEELGWDHPSKIQNTAIPLISKIDEESK